MDGTKVGRAGGMEGMENLNELVSHVVRNRLHEDRTRNFVRRETA